jgi:tetratricopeptide (TPR) repeat protein
MALQIGCCAIGSKGLRFCLTQAVLFSLGRGRVVAEEKCRRRVHCRELLASALALCLLALCGFARAAGESSGCVPVARVVSIQGALQIQRAGESTWSYIRRLDTVVCQGDLLHTGSTARAALLISPETLFRVQQNSTVSVRQTADETVVEYVVSEVQQPVRLAPNTCGAGYFITRFPRKFRVLTPFINASVEGTEFLVALSCQSATVAVFEGKVLAKQLLVADSTAFSLRDGEQVTVGGAEPPAVKLIVKPLDAVQWALFYPPLTQPAGEEAADQPCNQVDDVARGQCILQRAEQRLRMGRVEEAEADLEALSAIAPNSGEPYALRSIIRVTKNDKAEALSLAERATQLSPDSARAWIALSYAHQAAFELEKALDAARKSAELAPNISTAQARVAELLMSLGRIKDAEKAARTAVRANPSDARAHMVLGFVHLAQINTKAAREDFVASIERDSSDPLPRLGLGLATIRDGDLKAGREQIEIAVLLDPTNSLIRSYMGKAYYEENSGARDQLATTQLGLAERLDPNDPTPWLYHALLKQSQNRPVEALEDAQTSIALNDNKAVYRSRLFLDEDRAARGATLATTYDQLGFRQLATLEAVKSLSSDPANSSAHRFLSDSITQDQRQEITRLSELLQAQIRQPAILIPTPPQLLFRDVAFLPSTAFSRVSYNEYAPLFETGGIRARVSGVSGNFETWGEDAALSAAAGPGSVALGQMHYQTDGFRPNNDITHDIYSALGNLQFNPQVGAQVEIRSRKTETGDIRLAGNPDDFSSTFRRNFNTDVIRAGLHVSPSPAHDFVLSYINGKLEDKQFIPGFTALTPTGDCTSDLTVDAEDRSDQLEFQYSYNSSRVRIQAGGGGYDLSSTRFDSFSDPCASLNQASPSDGRGRNLYLLGTLSLTPSIAVILGASKDVVEDANLKVDEVNPKLGLLARIAPGLMLRAAAFGSVKPALVASQTLQPTQLLGFSQFSDDTNGTDSDVQAIALDWTSGRGLYAGLELRRRHFDFPLNVLDVPFFLSTEEYHHAAYAFWTPTKRLALSLRYFRDELQLPTIDASAAGLPERITTYVVPVGITYASPSGLTAGLTVQFVKQYLASPTLDSDDVSNFSLVNVGLAYRLPRRLGWLSFEVNNVFDRSFDYQDTNFLAAEPTPPPFLPARTFAGKVSLYF